LGPVALALVFVGLFAVANPIVESWMTSVGDWASDLGALFEAWRLVFWMVVLVGCWALLRAPHRVGDVAKGRSGGTEVMERLFAPEFIVRCLILFNVVFAVQTALDMMYLIGGTELPEGMTYKEYARRGAYPLVATALLAGLFVILTFRPGENADRMTWARRLVYLWLVQNIVLLGSAIWRLDLYIEAYQLTRLRLAAAIWMGLVAWGFAWVILRIRLNRSNGWLMGVNGITAAVVLLICCFMDMDGAIARHNVASYLDGKKEELWIDADYLEHLGPSSLPALQRLVLESPDFSGDANAEIHKAWIQSRAVEISKSLVERLDRQTADWRGWTWRRHRLSSMAASVRAHGSELQ
jgi:hypothetical protein